MNLALITTILGLGAFTVNSFSLFTSIPNNKRQGTAVFANSGVTRNENFAKLVGGYLFPEIGRRRTAYLKNHPEAEGKIISLGIGDTTQPIPSHILSGLVNGATKLGTKEGYSGYGAEQGTKELREKIA